jgi:ethanolamine utilization protein EutA
MAIKATEKRITSVGIDIGTSTSHLIFSELVLRKDQSSNTNKFIVADRNIKYRSQILFTPLLSTNEIDMKRLFPALLAEYQKAQINPTDIESGAVIITGESAKKENAERIVDKLAKETGNFVASTAGPNFESIISAHGSGAVKFSEVHNCKVIHTDVGGGTSNIAVIDNGDITSTACINVGGRLIAFDNENIITRLEPAGRLALKQCGVSKTIGDKLSLKEIEIVCEILTRSLLEAITISNLSDISQELMMTDPLPSDSFNDLPLLSFSGGVAEFIYQKTDQDFNDLGRELGKRIREQLLKLERQFIETPEKIRATVIGASGYTLNVSGSTTFISENSMKINLPLKNIPIVEPHIRRDLLSIDYVATQIRNALVRLDINEGTEEFVLGFKDPVRSSYKKLTTFSKGIVKALPKTIDSGKPIFMIFEKDIGNSVGNVMKRETGIANEILSLDEIEGVQEGQFIDIGKPLFNNRVFPVVVKSLIFG